MQNASYFIYNVMPLLKMSLPIMKTCSISLLSHSPSPNIYHNPQEHDPLRVREKGLAEVSWQHKIQYLNTLLFIAPL